MENGCTDAAAVKWVNCPLANSIPMVTAGLYDLVVLFLVAVFAWRGYQKGLVAQLGALLVLIVVGAISVRYTPSLTDFLGSGNTSSAISFIIIIIIVTLIVWNIVNALSKLVNKLKLKSWNYQMGALLGVINGIFVSMLLTFLLLVFVIPHSAANDNGTYSQVKYDSDKSFIKNSFFGPYLTNAMLTAIDRLPQGSDNSQFYNNLRDLLQSRAENIKENHPDLQQQTYESNSYDNYDNRQYDNRQYDNRQYPSQDQYGQPGYHQTRQPGYQQNQDYPDQSYPNPGYQNQGYPDRRYPNQGQSGYNGGSYPSQPQRQPSSNPGYNGASPLNGVL